MLFNPSACCDVICYAVICCAKVSYTEVKYAMTCCALVCGVTLLINVPCCDELCDAMLRHDLLC